MIKYDFKKIFAVLLFIQLSLPKLEARNIVNEQTDSNLVKINDTKNNIIGNLSNWIIIDLRIVVIF